LPTLDDTVGDTDVRNIARRALHAYYMRRGPEIDMEKPADWPYRKFFQHHDAIMAFGGQIQNRLDFYPLPAELDALTLADSGFALQCKNLYDCCQTSDILNFRLIEMHYSGFDSHADEQTSLNTKLQDILGAGGGLDTMTTRIAADMPNAIGNLTFLFSSDFGRQLMSNGTAGTDHGTGTYSILIGDQVRGGAYGDMFPLRESLPDPDDSLDRSPFELHGKDIAGLTSFERVYAQACDWVSPGAGDAVFPGAATSDIERDGSNVPIDLSGLFSS
jgi:hypothetical protein